MPIQIWLVMEPFVLNEIAGCIGLDYKGNVAASYARWFTQVEISVLRGEFTKEELRSFCRGLVPAVAEAVPQIGQKAFALTSHTARFHVPRWTADDPVNRVNWREASRFESGQLPADVPFVPMRFQSFICDSVGTFSHEDGMEYQFLLRDSQKSDRLYLDMESSEVSWKLISGIDWETDRKADEMEYRKNLPGGAGSDFM